MSLNPVSNWQPAASPVVRASVGQSLKQAARSTYNNLYNAAVTQIQHPGRMKTNAFVLSALILVLTRMFIANKSAIQAKGTPDESLRQREAIRTNIRELVGWTLSYGVLRFIQSGFSWMTRKAFGIKPEEHYSFWTVITNQGRVLKNMLTGGNGEVKKIVAEEIKRDAFEYSNKARGELLEKGLKALHLDKLGLKDVRAFYRYVPVIAASVPAIFLSGYLLERFTRDHSQDVITAINHQLGGEKPAPASSHVSPIQNRQFQDYLDRISQGRASRQG